MMCSHRRVSLLKLIATFGAIKMLFAKVYKSYANCCMRFSDNNCHTEFVISNPSRSQRFEAMQQPVTIFAFLIAS